MPSWWGRSKSSRRSETRNTNKVEKLKAKSFDGSILIYQRKISVEAYPLPKPIMNLETSPNSSVSLSSSSSVCSNENNNESFDVSVNDQAGFDSVRLIEEKSLFSPSEKRENKKHPCHPLPLPPDSPVKYSSTNWIKGKLLGRGTFGHVYAAFNSENGQMCAMKEVSVISDDQKSTECLKQLNQEIALLSELSHPNIVQYYGSKMVDDKLSVYLEYVSGGSIRKLLNEYGPFAEAVIRNYTKQILCGLAYLHGRNTVHRDIKGANILVGPNGEIKLVDFGMAKHIKSVSSMLSFKGSPYWMSPEVIMNTSSSSYSLAVDIWSLGCTILEMATSKPPWSEYEGVAAIFKIANSSDYPEIPSYLSEDVQSFVKLCLQRDPSVRPTAAQLLHHPFIQNQDMREIASTSPIDKVLSTYGRRFMLTSHSYSHHSNSPARERANNRMKYTIEPSRSLKILSR